MVTSATAGLKCVDKTVSLERDVTRRLQAASLKERATLLIQWKPCKCHDVWNSAHGSYFCYKDCHSTQNATENRVATSVIKTATVHKMLRRAG